MKVREIMTPNPFSVKPNSSIVKVKELFDAKKIWAIYIVNTNGRAVGVITQQDYSDRFSPHVKIASDMMSKQVYTIDVDDDASKVWDLLTQHQIGSIAVTENGRFCGIVTRNDFKNRYVQPTKQKTCDYCKSTVSYMGFFTCPYCNMLLCGYHRAAESHHCKGIDWDNLKKKEHEQSQERWEKYKRELALKRTINSVAKLLIILIIIVFIAVNFFPNYVGLLGFNKCSDNTSSGWCSVNKPYFCNEGVLIYEANKCGCSGNQIAVNNLCKTPMNCSDGTPHGACSLSKPIFCYDGSLIEKATKCGCPADYIVQENSCETLKEFEQKDAKDAFNYLNSIRLSYNRTQIIWDDRVYDLAVFRSRDMYERNYFDHETPEGKCANDFKGEYNLSGYILAENIGAEMIGYTPATMEYSGTIDIRGQVDGWMDSRGHRYNLLYPEHLIGAIGCYKGVCTFLGAHQDPYGLGAGPCTTGAEGLQYWNTVPLQPGEIK